MRPRHPTHRVKSLKPPRAPNKTARAEEYFFRSWVLDEINRYVVPVTKDLYGMRKTLYEERREILNRISLLEEDVRNITSILTTERYTRHHNAKRWLSRSSVFPSNTSSLDNINEITEVHSPVMIDVRRLEFQLQQKAAKSLEDLTLLQGAKLARMDSQIFGNGTETDLILSEVTNEARKRSWQSSQSMDTGLDRIPSGQTRSPLMDLLKRSVANDLGHAPNNSKNIYTREQQLIGSPYPDIDEDLKENENPSPRRAVKRKLTVEPTFKEDRAPCLGTSKLRKFCLKSLEENTFNGNDESAVAVGTKVNNAKNREEIFKGNLLEAESEADEELNMNLLVQLTEAAHRKYSDIYTDICKIVQHQEGGMKLSSEYYTKISTSQNQFLELLKKSKSGTLIRADAKLAQDLVDDIEEIYAYLQAVGTIGKKKKNNKHEGEFSTNQTQNEISQDTGLTVTKLSGGVDSVLPVKRRIYNEGNGNQDAAEINTPKTEFNKNTANLNNTTHEYSSGTERMNSSNYDLRMFLDNKRSNSRRAYHEEKENQCSKEKQIITCKTVFSKNTSNPKDTTHSTRFETNNGSPNDDLRELCDGRRAKSSIISSGRLEDYQALLENYKKVEEALADFSKDRSLKTLRTDCQKAVNLTLNTITANCASHLLDKYKKLSSLLNNETVIISEKPITASLHPLATLYSLNYLAMKTVKQGEHCVSHNPKVAFAIASVVVALWTDMPQFGKLLLSQFYHASPYLIPMYWEREDDESDEQYSKRLGYLYSNSQKEDPDRFLKRHSGIMRLYCAIIVTPQKTSNGSKPHPLPLKEAWKWLTLFLTIPPIPDISATLLLDMLEITGHMMASKYKSQFWKILDFINNSYLLSIEQVTQIGRKGPLSRLRGFMEVVLAAKAIPPPEGILPSDFW